MTRLPTVSQAQAISPSPATMNVNPTIRPVKEWRSAMEATQDDAGTTDVTRLASATTTAPTTPRTIGERMAGP